MKIHEKYLEALKTFDEYVTVSEWAIRFGEIYPELLEKAEKEAKKHKKPSTGLREIAARIGSWISTGDFDKFLKVDTSERPRKVKYISKEELKENIHIEVDEDIEPIKRQDIINNAKNRMQVLEVYRISEFENIQKSFKQFFGVDFEIDHAEALLNDEKQGEHHPDNLQFLLKYHNGKKNKNSWERFTFDEQAEYIKQTISLQNLIASKLDIEIDQQILDSLLNRLKQVY